MTENEKKYIVEDIAAALRIYFLDKNVFTYCLNDCVHKFYYQIKLDYLQSGECCRTLNESWFSEYNSGTSIYKRNMVSKLIAYFKMNAYCLKTGDWDRRNIPNQFENLLVRLYNYYPVNENWEVQFDVINGVTTLTFDRFDFHTSVWIEEKDVLNDIIFERICCNVDSAYEKYEMKKGHRDYSSGRSMLLKWLSAYMPRSEGWVVSFSPDYSKILNNVHVIECSKPAEKYFFRKELTLEIFYRMKNTEGDDIQIFAKNTSHLVMEDYNVMNKFGDIHSYSDFERVFFDFCKRYGLSASIEAVPVFMPTYSVRQKTMPTSYIAGNYELYSLYVYSDATKKCWRREVSAAELMSMSIYGRKEFVKKMFKELSGIVYGCHEPKSLNVTTKGLTSDVMSDFYKLPLKDECMRGLRSNIMSVDDFYPSLIGECAKSLKTEFFAEFVKKEKENKDMGKTYIVKVIFNDPATIVIWSNGMKTVVKAGKGEKYDPEKGLAMAISKMSLGNEGKYYECFKHFLKDYVPPKKAEKSKKESKKK